MKKQTIKATDTKEFNQLFRKTKVSEKKPWETIFKDTLKQINHFSATQSFWYVGDFSKGVVAVGGEVELATPINKKDWIGLNPMDIGSFFHPSDVSKMQAFTVFVARYLAEKTPYQRKNVRVSFIFRMLNAQNKYTWRKMEYPGLHYEFNQPRFIICHVTEIEHMQLNPKCIMYIYDTNNIEPVLYYCEEDKVQLKPFYDTKPLSDREKEVLKLLVKGLISKEIAVALKISKNTVENHKQNIFTKTKTKNIAELVGSAHKFIDLL